MVTIELDFTNREPTSEEREKVERDYVIEMQDFVRNQRIEREMKLFDEWFESQGLSPERRLPCWYGWQAGREQLTEELGGNPFEGR